MRAVWILIIAQHLFMRAGTSLAEPPGDSAHAAGWPLSPLVRPSCFSRLSRSKPQHINNICSTPVQAPRERTRRSYHFFIREQVPYYPDLIGFGRLTPSTRPRPPSPPHSFLSENLSHVIVVRHQVASERSYWLFQRVVSWF